MPPITVKAKIDAGYHPGLNMNIVKEIPNEAGKMVPAEYTIDESQWGDQLFERPSPEWLAPWERESMITNELQQPADASAVETKVGGKKK